MERMLMMDEANTDEWREFQATKDWWAVALRELLNWPPSRISDWIKKEEDTCTEEGHFGWCLHETPAYWLARLLISPQVKAAAEQKGVRTWILKGRLQCAIEDNKGIKYYFGPGPDWEACRRRVEAVLAEYGGTLPRTDDEAGEK